MKYWIIKSEPFKYPWEQLEKDGKTTWDGIRNYAARINLREMKIGDICCFYHSNEGKEIVGLAKVTREAFPDPTTEDPAWVAVEVAAWKKLRKPVTLAQMKQEPLLQNNDLIRIGRLSVCKLEEDGFNAILKLSEE